MAATSFSRSFLHGGRDDRAGVGTSIAVASGGEQGPGRTGASLAVTIPFAADHVRCRRAARRSPTVSVVPAADRPPVLGGSPRDRRGGTGWGLGHRGRARG